MAGSDCLGRLLGSRWGLWWGAFLVKLVLFALLVAPRWGAWEQRLSYANAEEASAGRQGHYDDMGYMEIARRLAATGELLSPYYREEMPQVHRTAGYPAILAALGMATGWNLAAMLLLQAAVLSWIPVVLRELLKWAGWPCWVAWGLAVDPLLNILSLSFMTEGWMVLLLLLAVLCWVRGEDPGCRVWAFLALGAAILVKPTLQFFFAYFVAAGLVIFPRRWVTIGAAALGAAVVGLYVARNYGLCGTPVISTQSDGVIALKFIMEAERTGRTVDELMKERGREEGRSVNRMITDNRLDFVGETKAYLKEHPVDFVLQHVRGTLWVLWGTGREHIRQVFWQGKAPPVWLARGYDAGVVVYYSALYLTVALVARREFLTHRLSLLSLLFTGYNLALIGAFAFLVGGGLKRAVFVPFLLLLLAHGLASAGMKGSVAAWLAGNKLWPGGGILLQRRAQS